jgi:dimethylaniline monooxygenase (N-oxide forming)
MEKKRVAIIGAGVSGIIAIKCCLDEELEPVCFERTGNIGGLWRYEEETTEGQGCVMKTTVINTSKEMMAFSDFPPPADFANFMHNTKVLDYILLYAKHFDVLKHVLYQQEIVSVQKADDFDSTGRWVLTIRDHSNTAASTKSERREIFDAVLVCTGHHADKKLPNFPGHEVFRGRQIHTHDYRHHKGLEDKRVVVVGIGNSGGDVAVELSKIAKQVGGKMC